MLEILSVEYRRIVEDMKVMLEKNGGFKNKISEDNPQFEIISLRDTCIN